MLVSVILSSVLLILGLSASQTIFRQIRVQYDYGQAQQAYYSAQAAIENDLYNIKTNLPGYEKSESIDLNSDSVKDYLTVIKGQSSTLPCIQDEQDNGWYELQVQESFKLPLFLASENDGQIDLQDFVVEFFVDRPEDEAVYLPSSGDVIKWSILGIQKNSSKISESMQSYIPLSEGKVTESSPTVFGTSQENYSSAQFYEPESYLDIDQDTKYIFYPSYPIETFLEDHVSNYLIIQNVIDLAKQSSTCSSPECNVVKFRIKSNDASVKFACEDTLISVDGYADNVKQSLDVEYSRADFLPVFDFALFQYDGD